MIKSFIGETVTRDEINDLIRATATPRGMWSNPTALYRLIGILTGCTRMEVANDIKASITRRRTSIEVQDIVSTIGDKGYRRPLAFTKNNMNLHIKHCIQIGNTVLSVYPIYYA